MSSTALWYTTRASGIVALVLLTVAMVLGLGTASRVRARHWPGYAQQEIHRRISLIATVFVGIHVFSSVLDTYVDISWATFIVPFVSVYDRFWVGVGTISLDLLLAVLVSSLLRNRMRPEAWRALHWLAYLCWPVALAHTFGLGTDAGQPWVMILAALCIVAVAVALVWRLRTAARHRLTGARAAAPNAPRKHLVISHRADGAHRGS